MSKRILGNQPRHDQPTYPTYEEFDAGRRPAPKHLGVLGAVLLGAATFVGCDATGGLPIMPDGRIDILHRHDASSTDSASDQRADRTPKLPDADHAERSAGE